jgi:hypothetical protein
MMMIHVLFTADKSAVSHAAGSLKTLQGLPRINPRFDEAAKSLMGTAAAGAGNARRCEAAHNRR